MSNVSGTIVAYSPLALPGQIWSGREQPCSGLRFTSLLSRETRITINGEQDALRTCSAICFPRVAKRLGTAPAPIGLMPIRKKPSGLAVPVL